METNTRQRSNSPSPIITQHSRHHHSPSHHHRHHSNKIDQEGNLHQNVHHLSCSSPPQSPASSSLPHTLTSQQQYGTCSPTISSTTAAVNFQSGALSSAYPNIIIPTSLQHFSSSSSLSQIHNNNNDQTTKNVTIKTTTTSSSPPTVLAAPPLPHCHSQLALSRRANFDDGDNVLNNNTTKTARYSEDVTSPAAATTTQDETHAWTYGGDRRVAADTTRSSSSVVRAASSTSSSSPSTKHDSDDSALQKKRRKQSYPTRCDEDNNRQPRQSEKTDESAASNSIQYANNGIAPVLLERLESVARAAFGGLPQFAADIPTSSSTLSSSLVDPLSLLHGAKTSEQPNYQPPLKTGSFETSSNKFCHKCDRKFSTSTYLRTHLAVRHGVGQVPENYNTKKHLLQQQQQRQRRKSTEISQPTSSAASFSSELAESGNQAGDTEEDDRQDSLSTSSASSPQDRLIRFATALTQTELTGCSPSVNTPSTAAAPPPPPPGTLNTTSESAIARRRANQRERQQRRRSRRAAAAAAEQHNRPSATEPKHNSGLPLTSAATTTAQNSKAVSSIGHESSSINLSSLVDSNKSRTVESVPTVPSILQQLLTQQQHHHQNLPSLAVQTQPQPLVQLPTGTGILQQQQPSSSSAVAPSLVAPLLTTLLNMNPNILASLLQQQKLKQQHQLSEEIGKSLANSEQALLPAIPATTQQLMASMSSQPTIQQITPISAHESILSRLQSILAANAIQQHVNSPTPSLASILPSAVSNLKLPLDVLLERFRGVQPAVPPPPPSNQEAVLTSVSLPFSSTLTSAAFNSSSAFTSTASNKTISAPVSTPFAANSYSEVSVKTEAATTAASSQPPQASSSSLFEQIGLPLSSNLPPNIWQQLHAAAIMQHQQHQQLFQQNGLPRMFLPPQLQQQMRYPYQPPNAFLRPNQQQLVHDMAIPPNMFPPSNSSAFTSANSVSTAFTMAHPLLPPLPLQFLSQPLSSANSVPPTPSGGQTQLNDIHKFLLQQQLQQNPQNLSQLQPVGMMFGPPPPSLQLPLLRPNTDNNQPRFELNSANGTTSLNDLQQQRFPPPTSSSLLLRTNSSATTTTRLSQVYRCGECGIDFPSKFVLDCHKQQAHAIAMSAERSDRTSRRTSSEADGAGGAVSSPFSDECFADEDDGREEGAASGDVSGEPDSSGNRKRRRRSNAKRNEQLPKRVVNPFKVDPEAFCEICRTEVCSKYFLRTHKQNLHHIPPEAQNSSEMRANRDRVLEEMRQEARTRSMAEQLKQVAATLNVDVTNSAQMATLAASLPPQPFMGNTAKNFCNFCSKDLCNKYFLSTHMRKMHNIIIEDEPGRRRRRGGAKKRQKVEQQTFSSSETGVLTHSMAAVGGSSSFLSESRSESLFSSTTLAVQQAAAVGMDFSMEDDVLRDSRSDATGHEREDYENTSNNVNAARKSATFETAAGEKDTYSELDQTTQSTNASTKVVDSAADKFAHCNENHLLTSGFHGFPPLPVSQEAPLPLEASVAASLLPALLQQHKVSLVESVLSQSSFVNLKEHFAQHSSSLPFPAVHPLENANSQAVSEQSFEPLSPRLVSESALATKTTAMNVDETDRSPLETHLPVKPASDQEAGYAELIDSESETVKPPNEAGQSPTTNTTSPSSSGETSERSTRSHRKFQKQEFHVRLLSSNEQPSESSNWIRADVENGGHELLSHVLPALCASKSPSFDRTTPSTQSEFKVKLPVHTSFSTPVLGNLLLIPVSNGTEKSTEHQ